MEIENIEQQETIEQQAKRVVGALRVAFVHDWMFTRRGGERVLENLLDLFPQAPVFALFGHPKASDMLRTKQKHTVHFSFLGKTPKIEKIYKVLLPFFPCAVESFNLQEFDVIISSSHCVAKGALPAPHALHLCYVHSPMRYAWDQEHTYFPQAVSFARPFELLRRLILSWLRVWDVSTTARINKIICNSRFVASRCLQYYGRKSTVVYPCVDVQRFEHIVPTEGPREQRSVLLFSAWTPNKNLQTALSVLVEHNIKVTAAGSGSLLEELAIKYAHLPNVTFIVSPSDRQVEELYASAHCYLFPSLEDFGIVAIEAMAAGLMVVAPNAGGTAETVIPGKTGYHFLHENWQDMITQVKLALAAPKTPEQVQALRVYARKFSIENFQRQFLNVLQAAIEEKREANRPT